MSQDNFQLSVKMEIQNIKEAVNIVIDDKLSQFSTGFDMEMKGLAEKMDMLTRCLSKLERDSEERQELNTASQVQSTDAVAIDPFHPDVSVIAFNFKNTDSGDIHEAINKLIKDGLKLGNINVVRIEQLPGRDGKPGGIKIQLPNKNAKIEVLRAKKSLVKTADYKHVYLRGAMTHVERLIHLNFQKLINETPGGEKLKMTGNGRLVNRDFEDMTERGGNHWRFGGGGNRGLGPQRGRGRGVGRSAHFAARGGHGDGNFQNDFQQHLPKIQTPPRQPLSRHATRQTRCHNHCKWHTSNHTITTSNKAPKI